MATAIPIPPAELVLLATASEALATRQRLASAYDQRQRQDQHPWKRRAQRHEDLGFAPIQLDELEQVAPMVASLADLGASAQLVANLERAEAAGWSLAAAELPVVGDGAELRWSSEVDVRFEVRCAQARLRGEPEPQRRQRGCRTFVRPSKQACEPASVGHKR